jgi:hypothetical protein
VHLQIAAVLAYGRAIEGRIRENPPYLSAAEHVPPQLPSSPDIVAPLARLDRLFDSRRLAGLEDFANHTRRTWSDAGDPGEGAVGCQQVG